MHGDPARPAAAGSRPGRGLLLTAILSIQCMWAFNFIFAKIGLRELDGPTLATFRVVTASLLMSGFYFASHRRAPRTKLTWTGAKHFAVLGLFGVAGNQVLFTIGLNYTTVAHSALVVSTGPLSVLLLARLLRIEHITVKKLGGMLVAYAGVAVLATEHGLSPASTTWIGDLLTLCGSIAFAFYAVLGKRVAAKYDSMATNQYAFLIGAIIILPLAVWKGIHLDWGAVGWQGWSGVVYMAMFGSVAAYILFYWALRYVAASRISAFSYLLPVMGTLLAWGILHEPITRRLLIAAPMVLGGVALAEVGFTRSTQD